MSVLNEEKLSVTDRKELDRSDFGLPNEKKFPLNDEDHVRKAIQFFKFCPVDKRNVLAKNINKKIKEYGMDIEIDKGSLFYKYANRLTVSIKESNDIEYDTNNETLKRIYRIPLYNNNDIISLEKWCYGLYKNASNPVIDPDDIYNAMDKRYKEYTDFFKYDGLNVKNDVLMDYDVCAFATQKLIEKLLTPSSISGLINILETSDNVYHAFRCVCLVLDKLSLSKEESGESRAYEIQHIQLSTLKDRLSARIAMNPSFDPLATVDPFKDKNSEVWNDDMIDVLKYIHNEYKGFIDYPIRDNPLIKTNNSPRDNMDFLSYHINPKNICIDDAITKLEPEDFLVLYKYIPEVNIIQGSDKYGDSIFYASAPDKDEIYIITKDTRESGYGSFIYYMIWISCMEYSELTALTEEETEYAMNLAAYRRVKVVFDTNVPSVKAVDEAFKSLNINEDGDIKIEIAPNKSFMDSYSENHKLLDANWKNKNYEAMKENLCYVFALISIIERSEEYRRRDSEAVKARAFATNDFKTYLKHLQSVEPNFDFSKYYISSEYDKKIINLPKTTIIGIKNLIKAILM